MNSKDALLKEIADLEKEKEEWKKKIRRLDDYEQFETVKENIRIYRSLFYLKIPFSFLETVFYTQKDLLMKHANACFFEKVLDRAIEHDMDTKNKQVLATIPMYCSSTAKTSHGYVFTLMDPYRTIFTKPMQKVSDEEARKCQGRMLVVKIIIPENFRAVNSYEIKGYKPLKMTLTNVFDKEVPINYNTLFTRYKDVRSESEAVAAINQIEAYYKQFVQYIIVRVNDYELRIITDKKKIAVWFEKDQLWYGDEPCDSLPFIKVMGNQEQNNNDIFRYNDKPYLFTDEDIMY